MTVCTATFKLGANTPLNLLIIDQVRSGIFESARDAEQAHFKTYGISLVSISKDYPLRAVVNFIDSEHCMLYKLKFPNHFLQ